MASKLGELERRGACRHPVFGAVVCPPVFPEVPPSAGPEHFCSLFGLPSVFTGCSVIGRVVFRCSDWKFALENAVSSRADFVVSAKLALMIQCYPFFLQGMPFGTRFLLLGLMHRCVLNSHLHQVCIQYVHGDRRESKRQLCCPESCSRHLLLLSILCAAAREHNVPAHAKAMHPASTQIDDPRFNSLLNLGLNH